ncbi:uncharacterized protein K489DRAFT_380785 [Dissoconium aciculare CBS 342.82]|uniref:F-box domain-containing protein n=1 Tax=Dissoconium aciculare CBS 342.82 TaxID=1314786 RepID=A0A6J3M216_9PEZI|nr:uncharacterized protein K489DRAFT_380785 [Dissoconium aciculare CBS 342.82]KAF1822051.1 hypothetical protein K489DRAFT_380785 [Dissoconium aciculare CBS 342.82]
MAVPGMATPTSKSSPHFLHLPAEIRNLILHYVFSSDNTNNQENRQQQQPLRTCGTTSSFLLNESYTAQSTLSVLLVSKQFHHDSHLLALSRTPFLITTPFSSIPERLTRLPSRSLSSLRSITFVADARQFREMRKWGAHPFGVAALRLESLTCVLHRSSCWHYLFDFTADLVALLRGLRGVDRFAFVRNHARVKGGFRTWYHRFVGLLLKVDHQQRFLLPCASPARSPSSEEEGGGGGEGGEQGVSCPEESWWEWRFAEVEQMVELKCLPPKAVVEEETYMRMILPLMEALRDSVERGEGMVGDARGWGEI